MTLTFLHANLIWMAILMCNRNCKYIKKLKQHCRMLYAVAKANDNSYKGASDMNRHWIDELNAAYETIASLKTENAKLKSILMNIKE